MSFRETCKTRKHGVPLCSGLKCPFESWALIREAPCCPFRARFAGPAVVLGGERTWVSGGCGPTEQHGHLLIRNTLLLSHAHGLTKVGSQDVFTLGEKSTDADSLNVINDTDMKP